MVRLHQSPDIQTFTFALKGLMGVFFCIDSTARFSAGFKTTVYEHIQLYTLEDLLSWGTQTRRSDRKLCQMKMRI